MKNKLIKITTGFMAAMMLAPLGVIRADETDTQEDPGYCIGIGSVSKMYATTAVMQLVDKGLVELDALVTDYIDDFKMADERYKDITVRMLMNHQSGLMGTRYIDSFRLGHAGSEYHDLFLEHLSSERLKAAPGEYTCYCNDGFTLLEILVERVTGQSFTDYVEENICAPLGLKNTGSMWNMNLDSNQVPLFTENGVRLPAEYTQLIGAGGILSDSEDLCKFGTAFFDGNDVLLSESAKKEMSTKNTAPGVLDSFGLGWDDVSIEDYANAGVTVVTKGGDTANMHAAVLVAPEEKISVGVVSAQGNSGTNTKIAEALMDIVLEERGTTIEHPEREPLETVDKVPEELLKYEGIYSDSGSIYKVSFPDNAYMSIVRLTAEKSGELQYMYTTEGNFVQMTGDIEAGNAIQDRPISTVEFKEVGGSVFAIENGDTYMLQKFESNEVSTAAQSAWDNRSGKKYYLVNAGPFDFSYFGQGIRTLTTSSEAPGYVDGQSIIDENHAMNMISAPGMLSRDIDDYEISTRDGREYLKLTATGYEYVSEDAVPEFASDITSVALGSEASWYRINGLKDETITLDIPDDASVIVYDKLGNVTYASCYVDYGNTVPLPEYGIIVFVGESGSSVGIRR